MSAGTLTLTNNSASVSGAGTTFTTDLAAGDFIVATVGGVPYTLPVKTVGSNTALTLVSNFSGPTQAGVAWMAVPRVALNMVTAALVVQSTEALRGLNYDKQNWQQIFSGTGTVTVKLPDGSSFSGPAWGGIVTALNGISDSVSGKMDKSQNLADLTDASVARTNLGLGSSAAKDVTTGNYDQTSGRLIGVGNFGLGLITENTPSPTQLFCGFIRFSGSSGDPLPYANGINICWDSSGTQGWQLARATGSNNTGNGHPKWRSINNSGASAWFDLYSSANTTRASDGTLKAASPVIKLFSDGRYETNEEAEGCTVTRLSAGVYLVEGCDALNSDAAWGGIDGGFDIPTDRNKQPLIWLDYEVNADGSVLVKTFHRRNPDAPLFARNEIDDRAEGDPVDIPADQFVSVRVEMPVESLYNQKMRQNEAELAAGAKG